MKREEGSCDSSPEAGERCGPGYYRNASRPKNNQCIPCPQDTFKTGCNSDETCISCHSYSFTNFTVGNTNRLQCLCNAGYEIQGLVYAKHVRLKLLYIKMMLEIMHVKCVEALKRAS